MQIFEVINFLKNNVTNIFQIYDYLVKKIVLSDISQLFMQKIKTYDENLIILQLFFIV